MPGPGGDRQRLLGRRAFHPLTVTDRLTAEPPAFGVALAHVWPSARRRGRGARSPAARPRSAGRGERTDVHADRRSEPDGPRVVELAARLGGGHDAELCPAAIGVDLNALALAAALGESRRRRPTPDAAGRRLRSLPRRAARASWSRVRRARRGASRRRCRSTPEPTGGRAGCSARSARAPTAPASSSRPVARRADALATSRSGCRLVRFERVRMPRIG